MKTIEEAARDYAEKHGFRVPYDGTNEFYDKVDVRASFDGFEAGVAFAEEWISVRDELPENQDIVFIKTDKGCYGTGYLHGKKSGFIVYGIEAYKEFGDVSHWKPINRK